MKMFRNLVSSLLLVALLPCAGWATLRTAASCNNTAGTPDVQAKIDLSTDGDTVVIPAGSCTWTKTAVIASKGILLQGAGIGSTNITDQGDDTAALKITGASAAHPTRLTGITFIASSVHANGVIQVFGTSPRTAQVGFRVDHIEIDNTVNNSRLLYIYWIWGLVDHVTFAPNVSASVQSLAADGSSNGADLGFTPWAIDGWYGFGSVNAVYGEDNTFTIGTAVADTATDLYLGARAVWRSNAVNGPQEFGTHGTDSGANRSPILGEVYRNTFTNNSGSTHNAYDIRGGVGIWFDNTWTGSTSWNDISVQPYRACWLDSSNYSTWSPCDGTQLKLGSTNWSDIQASTGSAGGTVKFCSGNRDLECTADSTCSNANAGTCSTFLDGAGTGGYMCRDNPGVRPGQVLQPMYAFGNTGTPVITPTDRGSSHCTLSNYYQDNREYYNYTASFNGSTGVGRGARGVRPSNCTTGVAYWSTDGGGNWSLNGSDGALDYCDSTNHWTNDWYVPYTYPYPVSATNGLSLGDSLAITQQPSNTASGNAISPAPVFTVTLPTTGTDTNSADTVGVSISGCGASLSGTTSVAAVLGVATFSSLTVNTAASGCTLSVSGTGLIGATTSSFNVTGAGATPSLGVGRVRRK